MELKFLVSVVAGGGSDDAIVHSWGKHKASCHTMISQTSSEPKSHVSYDRLLVEISDREIDSN
jgi:hypothetical protein